MKNGLLRHMDMSVFVKSKDLQNRVLFTIFVLFVYRFGSYIPIPGLDPVAIGSFMKSHVKGIFAMLDMFSGGSLGRMTVFALNIMPYISASIIMQIMTYAVPSLAVLRKDGASGKTKITQYTRYLTIVIAMFQAYGVCAGLMYLNPTPVMIGGIFPLIGVPTLVSGTMITMWLGEQISSRGIGNGVSLLIYAGIIANIPNGIINILEFGRGGAISTWAIFILFAFIASLVLLVVFFEKAQRCIKFMYPSKQRGIGSTNCNDNTHLPLKINSAGVIPPIFANSLLLLPATIINFVSSGGNSSTFIQKLAYYLNFNHPVFTILYALLIIFFAFFYTAIVFNSEETANNLKKSGGAIPGIRPGVATADYFDYVLTRITVVGSVYLVVICIFPQMLLSHYSIPAYLSGTSVLILVSVAIDTVSQVYTHMLSQGYEGLLRRQQRRLKK